jgi:hypothetical protein
MIPRWWGSKAARFLKGVSRPWPTRQKRARGKTPAHDRHHDRAAARPPYGEIARIGRNSSFGTNDLTQTTLGFRATMRETASEYLARGLIDRDPFVSIDRNGVGELVGPAVERGRNGQAQTGLGGEHRRSDSYVSS